MKKETKSRKRYLSCTLAALVAATVLPAGPAQAEDVYLNPGYVSGNISLGDITIDRSFIKAQNNDFTAELYSYDNTYTLTVNTPEGGSLDYEILSYIYSDAYKDYLHYPAKSVTVHDGQTTTHNLSVIPGILNGTVIIDEGCSIASGKAYSTADPSQYSGYRNTNLWKGSRTQFGSDGQFSVPVVPGDNLEIMASVKLSNGETVELSKKTATIGAGEEKSVQWNVSCGTLPATIKGSIQFNGISDVDSHTVRARKSLSSYDYVYATVENGPEGASYIFPTLTPGTWYLDAYSYANDNDDYFMHPRSSFSKTFTVEVAGGQTVVNDLITTASFINGNINISGTKRITDAKQAFIGSYADYYTLASYGNSRDKLNLLNGDYDLIASEGGWQPYYIYLSFYDTTPESYLNSYVYIYDYQADLLPNVNVLAGETVNNMDVAYKTGTVTVRYTVENQGVLSNPRLSGWGYTENNESRAYVRAYGPYGETTEGKVTFIGLPGDYDLKAEAYVGGSLTTFGDLQIQVIPGGEREMDIGGPDLAIDSPQPETYTDADSVLVSGKTSDGDSIKSVTVNGDGVAIVSTNNPTDPDEVSFSKEVALDPGPNAITVVTTDNFDKITSDTRKVFRDNGAPVIAWSPNNGSTVYDATITIAGTATDDNTITEVTVNGTAVDFALTGNPEDSNEVSFTTEITLTEGENQIVVSAADNCELITSETHTVTMVEKDVTAPQITCPADATFTDGDAITIGSAQATDNEDTNPSVSNNAPQSFNIGQTQVTWTATDSSGNSSTCTQAITVNEAPDTVAPSITCPTDITAEEGNEITLGTASASDDRDNAPQISSNAPNSFDVGTTEVLWTATDAAGNSATCTQSVTVNKKEDPVVEFSATPASDILWPPNHKYVTMNIGITALTESGLDVAGNATLVSVTSDEPENATEKKKGKSSKGDGNTTDDIVIVDNNTVKLRAERLGGGDGRVYTFNYQITDETGNTTSTSATVGVPLSIKRTPTDSGVQYTVKP